MKHLTHIAAGSMLTVLFAAGIASAQSIPTYGVSVTSTPVTTSVSPGSGVTLGTVQIMGNLTGTNLVSIPISVTGLNGASTSYLSNCQIYNASGTALGTGSNIVNNVVSGSNLFTFDQPLMVSSAGGTTSLTVRCNVSSSAPSGSAYQFVANQPVYASALNVNVATAPTLRSGAQNATLATIALSGLNSGTAVNLSSIPVTISASNGGSTANLSNCMLRSSSGVLNTGSNVPGSILNGGQTTFNLNSTFTVSPNSVPVVNLTCDVSAATPVGSIFTVSINPSAFSATNASTGASISATASVGTNPSNINLPAATSGTVVVSGAGTDIPTTPGVPNTGSGNTAQTMFILALSALVALGGTMYLRSEMQ